MNKTKIYGLILAGIAFFIVVAVGYYLASKKQEGADQEPKRSADADALQNDEGSALNTLKSLIDSGKSQKCTWKSTQGGDEMDGIIYIAKKGFRQTMFFSESDPSSGEINKYEFNVLSDGEWYYVWNSVVPGKGTKFKISELSKENEISKPYMDLPDFEEKLDYRCESWAADESYFNLPSGVDFADETKEMQEIQANPQLDLDKAMEQMCQMCEMAPSEELKSQCRTNAGCK